MKNKIQILGELTKIKITSFVTITTVFGFISFAGEISLRLIAPTIGILLLACGSAAINHYQEKNTDKIMNRTKSRPIPSGRISAVNALITALVLIAIGSIILFTGSGILALGLALLNLIWYNGIYTPLKKVNPLAIIPGSLVGAIPPMVGWVAAGGSIFDPQILILSFFFFIWQIPHFWLLLLILSKDYEKAGFPTLTQIFDDNQLSRITFVWILATIVTGLMIPLFGMVKNPLINFSLLIPAGWLLWKSLKLLKQTESKLSITFAFKEINMFALYLIILLSIDKLAI